MTHLFRLAVRVETVVDPAILTLALHAVLPRFPSFQVQLKPGFFWHSLVEDTSLPPVFPETPSPCQPFRRTVRSPHLFRVRWFHRRIAVEFGHALTDGMGGLTFLKALVAEYLAQVGPGAGGSDPDPGDIRRTRAVPDPSESRDEFQNLYDPAFPRYQTWDRAWQPRFSLLPKGSYAVTTGRLPLGGTLALAKAQGSTLTEFLAATLLAAFQDAFLGLPPAVRRNQARPLRLVLPVNLRPVFGSRTLRNFFVVVPVEIDLRLGSYDFPEILRKVHHQLQAEMDDKLLKKQIVRNLRGELNPLARLLPLPVKTLVLRGVYGAFERQHTASLSNLGRAEWPESWANRIHDVEFVPPPSPYCKVNVGVVSFADVLSVTFGNLSQDPAVERAFFTRLRTQGLAVRIESNRSVLEV
jgi:hypothetical protein